jgi:hypothetical protein
MRVAGAMVERAWKTRSSRGERQASALELIPHRRHVNRGFEPARLSCQTDRQTRSSGGSRPSRIRCRIYPWWTQERDGQTGDPPQGPGSAVHHRASRRDPPGRRSMQEAPVGWRLTSGDPETLGRSPASRLAPRPSRHWEPSGPRVCACSWISCQASDGSSRVVRRWLPRRPCARGLGSRCRTGRGGPCRCRRSGRLAPG